MKYSFEITSSPESKYHVCAACMFEEEVASPVLYLNEFANQHFGSLGIDSLGDQLDLRRRPLDGNSCDDDGVLCSAAYVMIAGVPTIRMIAGPLMKEEIYGNARGAH
jgi:hypothetical protein